MEYHADGAMAAAC